MIVIAGGIAAAGEQLLDPVRTVLRAQVTLPQPPQVMVSRITEGPGLAGAALIARRLQKAIN